jgi:hypothetical protein
VLPIIHKVSHVPRLLSELLLPPQLNCH